MLSRSTKVVEKTVVKNSLKSQDIEKFISYLMHILENRRFTTIKAKTQNLELSLRSFLKTSKIDQKMLKTTYGIIKNLTK